MTKSIARKSGRRACVALTAVLLASCSLPAMLGSEHSEVHGVVSLNGAEGTRDYSALYQKGKARFTAGQFGLAANEFQAALVLKRDSVEILNALGATYDRLARFDLADRYYKDALALDPKDPQTLNNLAYSLMLRGDPQHAIPLLDVAQSATPDPMIAANLVLAKRLEKKLEQPAVADAQPSDKGSDPTSSQEAAAQPAKSLWIERRSEEVQELIFDGGARAKSPAREWNLGSPALIVPLPPAPKASQTSASNDAPEGTVQVIPASYHAASSKDDVDSPIAVPLIPVSRSTVAELKPARGVTPAIEESKRIAETSPGAPIRLVEAASAEPTIKAAEVSDPTEHVRALVVETASSEATMKAAPPGPDDKVYWIVQTASAEPAIKAAKVADTPDHLRPIAVEAARAEPTTKSATVSGPVDHGRSIVVETASAEPTTKPAHVSDPPGHARSIPVETVMAPAAALSTSAPRKTVIQAAELSRRSSACPIEISNGAGKPGMASRFRAFAQAHGFDVRRLTNDRSFSNAHTIAYFKPGFEDGARKLAGLLSVPVAREPASQARCQVRLRLGHDLVNFDQRVPSRHATRTKS